MRFQTNPFQDFVIDPILDLDDDSPNNLFFVPPKNVPQVPSPVQTPVNMPTDRQIFDVLALDKKFRNRSTDNAAKHLATAIKALERQLGTIEFQESDVGRLLLIDACIKELRDAIKMLSSSNRNLEEIRCLINPHDPELIKKIEKKTRRSNVEQKVLDILNSYSDDPDIVEEAKYHIRWNMIWKMDDDWIRRFAVVFRQNQGEKTVEEKNKDFQIYLSYFKFCLEENGRIDATLKRKEFKRFKERNFPQSQ